MRCAVSGEEKMRMEKNFPANLNICSFIFSIPYMVHRCISTILVRIRNFVMHRKILFCLTCTRASWVSKEKAKMGAAYRYYRGANNLFVYEHFFSRKRGEVGERMV